VAIVPNQQHRAGNFMIWIAVWTIESSAQETVHRLLRRCQSAQERTAHSDLHARTVADLR